MFELKRYENTPHPGKIEIFSHSQLRYAWNYCPQDVDDKPVNWTVFSGGQAEGIFFKMQQMCIDKSVRGNSVIVGLMIFQNLVAKGMTFDEALDVVNKIERCFKKRYGQLP